MKKINFLLCLLIGVLSLSFFSSCGSSQSSYFSILSVRMKGNGDGTLTAVAQNEFSLGEEALPVTLTLYASAHYETDTDNMERLTDVSSENLKALQTITIAYPIVTEEYFCAEITYHINGEVRTVQSETVYYDRNGIRR